MAMWHCPHCGAPQAETARCWVCRKSSTTCSTCRHFRASLVSDIGYCALDRARRPLTGRELRGCWSQRPATIESGAAGEPSGRTAISQAGAAVALRGFVALEDLAPVPIEPEPPAAPSIAVLADGLEAGEARTSLFGELDR